MVNLENYIEPTRNRAELILHKGDNHKIDLIHLKNRKSLPRDLK
ncbi:Pantothenate kinase [Streptococcus sp. HSISS2]|nr:Pantothenate kinase [Streptococcus sp. HSISS2]